MFNGLDLSPEKNCKCFHWGPSVFPVYLHVTMTFHNKGEKLKID